MRKTRILWSGITGRTGVCAQEEVKNCDFAEICGGICRRDEQFYHYDALDNIRVDFDVMVDFSHKECFDKVLNFALKRKKPLVSGTSGLSENQLQRLAESSTVIPVFRDGNFRFRVKKFIDAAAELAKNYSGELKLVETHYKSKKIPSETAKVMARRIFAETGKTLLIESHLEYDELINDWKIGNLHCRVQGFGELARDVLQIAHKMADKKADGLYDLNRLAAEINLN